MIKKRAVRNLWKYWLPLIISRASVFERLGERITLEIYGNIGCL
jgi:hypothetical protein